MLKAVYPDGSWIVGKRYWYWDFDRTPGTHHLRVSATSGGLEGLVGKRVAVVIAQVKYFVVGKEVK